MKQLIFLLFSTPLYCLSQSETEPCIQSHWVLLQPSDENTVLFSLDTKTGKNNDIVTIVRELVRKDQLPIYTVSQNERNAIQWHPVDYKKELARRFPSEDNYHIKDVYFEALGEQPDRPLEDQWGEDSIALLSDGTWVIVYPDRPVSEFRAKDCNDIRVYETRIFKPGTNNHEYIPKGLGFYIEGEQKFWIKLDELALALKKKTDYDWYNALVGRNFRGTEYMQVHCD